MFPFKFKSIPSGFTLVEILVAISLVIAVSYFGLAYYSEFNRRQIIEQATKKIVSDLRLAQNMALTQQKPDSSVCVCTSLNGYFFYTEPAGYRIVPDCVPECLTDSKSENLEAVSLTGFSSIWFSVLAKRIEFTGGSGLTVTSPDAKYSLQVSIGQGGEIEIN